MTDPGSAQYCDVDGEVRCIEDFEGCRSGPGESSVEPTRTDILASTSVVYPPERIDQTSGSSGSGSSKTTSPKHSLSGTKTSGTYTLLDPTPSNDPPISASFSTETLANTTVTWLNGLPLHRATTLADRTAKITTTTYDAQSQTVVTTTETAVPANAPPYCNVNGQCTLFDECFVTIGGYITCPDSAYTRPVNGVAGSSSASSAKSTSFDQKHGSDVPSSSSPRSVAGTHTHTALPEPTSARLSSLKTAPLSATSSIASVEGVGVVYATAVVTIFVTAQPYIEIYVPVSTNILNSNTSTPIRALSAFTSSNFKISEDGACGESEQTCKDSSFGDCRSIHGGIY